MFEALEITMHNLKREFVAGKKDALEVTSSGDLQVRTLHIPLSYKKIYFYLYTFLKPTFVKDTVCHFIKVYIHVALISKNTLSVLIRYVKIGVMKDSKLDLSCYEHKTAVE